MRAYLTLMGLSSVLFFSALATNTAKANGPLYWFLNEKNQTNIALTFNQIDASAFPQIKCYVSITDNLGNPLSGLTEANFIVEEDGVVETPITVTPLGGTSVSISVALVIDRSGSMRGQKLIDAKLAAIEFVNLMQNQDKGAIVSFSNDILVNQNFTNDKALLINAIQSLTANGGTRLYDVAIQTVNLIKNQPGRKAVILLSDGEDTASSSTLNQAIAVAVTENVPIFTIGLGVSPGSTADVVLNRLANSTGGQYFVAPSSSDLEELYRLISRQLENQYKISYKTHNETLDGSVRSVKMTVNAHGSTDTKTKSYRAPGLPSGVPVFPHAMPHQSVGADFYVDVVVGTPQNPVIDLFGISFVLNYEKTIYLDTDESNISAGGFLGTDVVFYSKVEDDLGHVAIGVSRKSGSGGISGSGTVARIKFSSSADTPNGSQINFSLTNVVAINSNGESLALEPRSLMITMRYILVWPGDTNNDGIVNQVDVLPLGLFWNKTGPVRPNASMAWMGQPAPPWTPENATYADANGDGLVNQTDVLPIGINWGKTHSPLLNKGKVETEESVESLQSPGRLTLVIKGEGNPGENILIDVVGENVNNLFGISFEVLYDTQKLDAVEVTPGKLLGDDIIFFPQIEDSIGRVSIGISRKAGQGGVSGTGSIAEIKMFIDSTAQMGQSIPIQLTNIQANDPEGNTIEFQQFNTSVVVSVQRFHSTQVVSYRLYSNYPNPFNPETTIPYSIKEKAFVEVDILDIQGRLITTLVQANQLPGTYQIVWNGRDNSGRRLPAGIYLYRLKINRQTIETRKMSLVK